MDGLSKRPTGPDEASAAPQERRIRPRFTWPPPGLEAEQGRLWRVLLQLGLGSLVLVLPLLLAVAHRYPFWSYGLLGGAWWVLVLSSLLGLLITLAGLELLFRLLRRGARASRRGLGSFITLLVMSDRGRDGGFLLQGGRKYRGLEGRMRGRIARSRVLGSACVLLGTIWSPVGFSLSVFFAARGAISPSGMWLISLVPAGISLIIGILARGLEGTLIRKAESRKDTLEEEIRGDVTEWQETLEAYANQEGLDVGSQAPSDGRAFGWSSVAVVVIAVIVFMPAAAITVTSTMGPILGMVATPNFSRMNERAATAQVFQRFRNDPDSSITPTQAGQALHALGYVGDQRRLDLMQDPVREYDGSWFPDVGPEPLGIAPHLWARQLFPKVRQGLTRQERGLLEEVAAHPAHREFELLARAPAVDVAGTRWVLPLPDSLTMYSLPIPRFSSIRTGAYARVGVAALHLAEGRPAAAEETLRGIISAGFLVAEEGPTFIDNLIGYTIVKIGGDALESLYLASGRAEDAENLRWMRETAESVEMLARTAGVGGDVQASLQRMADVVVSPQSIRGLKWEFFVLLNTIGPCMNAHRVVFGPDERYTTWLETARSHLVRYPSEAEVFSAAQRGLMGTRASTASGSWITLFLRIGLGGGASPGSCAVTLGLAPQSM